MIESVSHITREDFFQKYVTRRKPCILKSIPSDLQCLRACQDLETLREHTGDVVVAVEPISDKGTFGTSATKRALTMASFLKSLQNGEKLYLTTQYSELEDNAILNEPLKSLTSKISIPILPELAMDLVPAKINLWLGTSSDGTSSGLHHDFHDNFYILLAGKKRFHIFPPSWKNCKELNLNGRPHEIFQNGLISYGKGLCSNGLTRSMQAQIRVEISEQHLALARKTGQDVVEAEQQYEDAMDDLLEAKMDDEDEEEDGDFEDTPENSLAEDDADDDGATDNEQEASMLGMNTEEEERLSTLPEFSIRTKNAQASNTIRVDCSRSSTLETDEEPPSFSSLSTEDVRNKLENPDLDGIEFDLEPGQMLYLPASYFHEVISTRAKHDYHMAVNYWFYPPDGVDTSYLEPVIMDELRKRALETYPTTKHLQTDKKVKI
ncbi:JmjC domain-containing protein 4 [Taphrina deformans PYCC 5710]|uniref:JmjC domain-containing protein 4 n=1 Tax=Taphrina deformans (strain PYCC 5710 / ATCC 11124 / CBS 356.35 / IMI 108563 / JCM 9778 / NBRC 8474) TaxID=1097556 RepID=R4X951_TAPDE|nr:JmjC domain-containing protein 4 [Taphrina deformans PYCC 5710]|eukprot:CCG82231.1 JmjC domain-containing protein 4 [Taphrina deformans PYCC 5710]